MPEQPADPIHYDMKIPPERKDRDQESESTKKHGDKINTGNSAADTNVNSSDDARKQESDR
jgi:hypothetical protein